MHQTLKIALATAALLGGLASADDSAPAAADDSAPAAAATLDQVERGAATYATHCAACHGPEGEGVGPFPAVAGANFLNRWSDRTAHELHEFVRTFMPLGQGGTLTDQEYVDVTTDLLVRNERVTAGGETELTAEGFAGIPIEAPAED